MVLVERTAAECADVDAARCAAISLIRDMISREGRWPIRNPERFISITDEAGKVVAIVTFEEAAGLSSMGSDLRSQHQEVSLATATCDRQTPDLEAPADHYLAGASDVTITNLGDEEANALLEEIQRCELDV